MSPIVSSGGKSTLQLCRVSHIANQGPDSREGLVVGVNDACERGLAVLRELPGSGQRVVRTSCGAACRSSTHKYLRRRVREVEIAPGECRVGIAQCATLLDTGKREMPSPLPVLSIDTFYISEEEHLPCLNSMYRGHACSLNQFSLGLCVQALERRSMPI